MDGDLAFNRSSFSILSKWNHHGNRKKGVEGELSDSSLLLRIVNR